MFAQSARSQLLAVFGIYKEASISNIEIEVFRSYRRACMFRSVVVCKTNVILICESLNLYEFAPHFHESECFPVST